MEQRLRDRDDKKKLQPTRSDESDEEAAGSAEDREARARRLLEAGDNAIQRALSRDSEQFLAQNRQQGGQ